jgi:hypothetical protein
MLGPPLQTGSLPMEDSHVINTLVTKRAKAVREAYDLAGGPPAMRR